MVRPAQRYEVHVTMNRKLDARSSLVVVRAILSRDGAEYGSGQVEFSSVGTRVIQIAVSNMSRHGIGPSIPYVVSSIRVGISIY